MNIAICDNEEMFVKNISGLLEEYLNENKLQYSIDMYSSGSELIGLKDKIVNYDIVFLDINMTGIDNIKVAEWIRMYSDRVIIISITSMSDYNIQGYKYDVFRCVLKDSMDLKGSIYECMNAVLYKLNYINSDKRIISCDSGSKEVDVSKIPGQVESCQLEMGMTCLEPGSVWNTMPCHTHDRRMEVYLYFEVPEDAVVFHYMGEPTETRHIVMRNEESVISPSWSIHSASATHAYTFIWGMVGENQDFDDMDDVDMKDLR